MLTGRLLTRDALPFLGMFVAFSAATLVGDALLHLAGLAWIGRYLGIPGTLLIGVSMIYSLRKRHVIHCGNPVRLLRWHQYLAWAGAWLVLLHAGIHFRALLPWLAVGVMLVNVASGLVGRFLVERGRRHLAERRRELEATGLSPDEVDARVHGDVLLLRAFRQWHEVHVPIALAFGGLGIVHILATFLFWGWK